jgi:hypothetical protein
MQVIILPAHHDLQDVVQLEQGGAAWHQNAPPDGRVSVIQGNFDLVDLRGFLRHVSRPFSTIIRMGLSDAPPASRASVAATAPAELEPALPLGGLIQEHIFEIAKRAAPLMARANLCGRPGLRTVVTKASIRR